MADPITQPLIAAMMQCEAPMVLTDPAAADHPMIAVNGAFCAMTGYADEDVVGRNCRFLQGEATDPASTRRLRTCIAEQRGCVEWLVNYRRDGAMFWNLLFLVPVFAADGRLLHYFGNQRDITQGPSASLPDYVLGKSDLPPEGVAQFNALLRDLVANASAGDDLDRLVAAARRLDFLTVRLVPGAWQA